MSTELRTVAVDENLSFHFFRDICFVSTLTKECWVCFSENIEEGLGFGWRGIEGS